MKKLISIAALALLVIAIVWGVKHARNDAPDQVPAPAGSHAVPISLINGRSFSLDVRDGYDIKVAREGLGHPRFPSMSPDGRLFVPDLDASEGKIFILSDWNAATMSFGSQALYLNHLRHPHSLAFYTDKSGIDWLYIALTDKLVRYKYTQGENAPTSLPETIAVFPDYAPTNSFEGWHHTRTVLIHNDHVYVSVGSTCNACEQTERLGGTIIEMDMDGKNMKILARGLRNAVGMVFKGDDLYVTGMGVDHLGDDKPEDVVYKVASGTDYGWPHCYQYQGIVYPDPTASTTKAFDCRTVPLANAVFPAHAAPLAIEYFDSSSASGLKNDFLVALHGSFDPKRERGDKVVEVDSTGVVSDFVTGFFNGVERNGRPAGILKNSDASFFFTDDTAGILYYVYKK